MKTGRTFIIAEAGVNHNGSLDTAKKLVDAASDARADAVKFQTFKAVNIVRQDSPVAEYQKKASPFTVSQYQLLKDLELDENSHKVLIDYCSQKKIKFLSTAFDTDSLDMLTKKLKLSLIKIPSGEITNGPLLLCASRTRKPMLLSTGMCTLDEIKSALGVIAFGYTRGKDRPSIKAFMDAFRSAEGQSALRKKVTLLHCTSEYPAPHDEIHLRAMETLRSTFNMRVGFSDHSEGIYTAVAAVALGAAVIEKHFTLDRTLPGPDHRASLEPGELREMVRAIRETEVSLGAPGKTPTPSELKNRDIVRKSLVAGKPVKKGELFSVENLLCKRPGYGLSPMVYWNVLGKRAGRDYGKDEVIDDIKAKGK